MIYGAEKTSEFLKSKLFISEKINSVIEDWYGMFGTILFILPFISKINFV